MPTKDKTKQAIWSARHYQKNKAQRLANNKERKANIRKWLREYRGHQECIECGESDERCLDFHHRNPDDKEIEVSRAYLKGWSVQRLMIEIIKCDVLCSNCHRKLHRGGLV